MEREDLVIVTAHAEFLQAAYAELKQLEPQLREVEELAPGIGLCNVPDAATLMQRASATRPIFVRHLAPVQETVALANNEEDLGTIAVALARLPGMRLLEKGTRFAVQTRFVQGDKSRGERPYSSGQLNRALAEALAEETGAIESIKKPQIVVSLLCSMQTAYLGISSAEENLSSWPGGNRHFAQTDEQISRAEFKLLEAFETFNIDLPAQGHALDLGAAPGGWTRLLLDAGMTVTAVDPANLDTRLLRQPGLEHYRGYAEDYLADALQKHRRFDAIVNDMRMDAREAARLLIQAAPCLQKEGFIISVFKLPHATLEVDPLLNLREALKILRTRYSIVQARQLFHNRQEVTVVAARPLLSRT
ncbi:MAG TPA: SAM-dependent methyltransferase [Ktedonobacteraceae bacterium]|nr:SAM-dependent methyltransferase [Ktedonobacteraceae bacterium]